MTISKIKSELANLRKTKTLLLKARRLREEVTIMQLEEVRESLPSVNGLKVNLSKTIEVVSKITRIPISELLSHGRREEVAHARFIIYYLARNRMFLKYDQIGKVFSRDHGTIMYGCRSLQDKLDTEPQFRQFLEKIEAELATYANTETAGN